MFMSTPCTISSARAARTKTESKACHHRSGPVKNSLPRPASRSSSSTRYRAAKTRWHTSSQAGNALGGLASTQLMLTFVE